MEQEIKSNKIIHEKYEVYWIDPNTIYYKFFEDAEIDTDDLIEAIEYQVSQKVNENNYRIVHIERHVNMTKEAREYLQNNSLQVKAEAYVIYNLAMKIMFNLYTKFRKNNHPLKAFNNDEEALNWLYKF